MVEARVITKFFSFLLWLWRVLSVKILGCDMGNVLGAGGAAALVLGKYVTVHLIGLCG